MIIKFINKFVRLFRKVLFKKNVPNYSEEKKESVNQYLVNKGVETEYGYVNFEGIPIIKKHPNSRIIIGRNVTILSDTNYNVAGINHPSILSTCAEGAIIELKDNCGLSGTTIVCVENVQIGFNVNIGVNVCIYDTDFHPLDYLERRKNPGFDLNKISHKSVKIGDDVWIGANSIILKGVTLGNRVIVGAGSVVTKSFPADCVIAGNPAKITRQLIN